MKQTRSGLRIADGLNLPADLVTRRVAILGMSGSGKSNALRTIVEQISAVRAPFTLIDRLGASWGLRSSKDGLGPGLPVAIFGGYHADVEIAPSHGAMLARELYETNAAAIVDLSAFDDDQACRFYAEHVRELLMLHNRRKRVRAFITDEAQRLAPETTNSKIEYASRSALRDLHTGGRGSGLGCITTSQSSAEQAKMTLKQAELIIALRTFSPLDQAPVRDYLRTTVEKTRANEIISTLSALEDGEAWFIAPSWLGITERHRFNLSTTFDSSRTPEIGETIEEPKVLASVDLARLRAAFAAPLDETADGSTTKNARSAAGVGDDGALVRANARIAALEREKAAIIAERDRNRSLLVSYKMAIVEFAPALKSLASLVAHVHQEADAVPSSVSPVEAPGPPHAARVTVAAQTPDTSAPRAAAAEAGKRRILRVLARYGGTVSKSDLGALADVNVRSGTLADYLRSLSTAGFVTYDKFAATITPEGAAEIGEAVRSQPMSAAEILAQYDDRIQEGAKRVLDILVAAYPESVSKTKLGEMADVNVRSGTLADYLRRLRGLGIVTHTKFEAQAADVLFRQS